MIYFLARILTQLMTCLIEGESASQITDSTPSRWGSRAKDAVFNAHCLTYIKETLKHQKIIFKGPSINYVIIHILFLVSVFTFDVVVKSTLLLSKIACFFYIPSLDNVIYGWPALQ